LAVNAAKAREAYCAQRNAQWQKWQGEAEKITAERQIRDLPAIARAVKRRLKLQEHWRTIERRLKKNWTT